MLYKSLTNPTAAKIYGFIGNLRPYYYNTVRNS